jgi:hypothetical protein
MMHYVLIRDTEYLVLRARTRFVGLGFEDVITSHVQMVAIMIEVNLFNDHICLVLRLIYRCTV